jgi:hypothetical protein
MLKHDIEDVRRLIRQQHDGLHEHARQERLARELRRAEERAAPRRRRSFAAMPARLVLALGIRRR